MKHWQVYLLIITLLFVSTCSSVPFPYSVEAPHYTVTFPSSNPYTRFTTIYPNASSPTTILTFFPSEVREVRLPSNIDNYGTDADLFTARVVNESVLIHQEIFNKNNGTFSTGIVSNYNYQGLQFNTTLSNGAFLSFSITLNLNSTLDLEIPREDKTCPYINRFAPNCSCLPNHKVTQYSLKVAVQLENWPFQPVQNENTTDAYIILTLELAGPFDLLYYLTLEDVSDLLSFDVCDVGETTLNMTDNVLIPLSFFTKAYLDDVPSQISTIFDLKSIYFNSEGLAVFPFQLLFSAFNKTLKYDPDFSVFINGNNGIDSAEGSGGNGGDGSGSNLTIIAAVVVPVVVVIIIVVIIAAVVFSVWKKKKLLGILHRSSELVRDSNGV